MLEENLRLILHEKNMTVQELAELSDISIETMKNIYYGRVKDPKVSTLISIAKALQCSVNYLLGDDSFMSKEEIEIIKNYRNCGKHGKSIINLISRFESCMTKSAKEATEKHCIPCIIPLDKVYDGFEYTSCKVEDVETTHKDGFIAVEMTTNAYSPVFYKGDRIVFKDSFPENGEQAAFIINGRVYFREFYEYGRSCMLKRFHGRNRDMSIYKLEELECIGVYVGVIRD